MMDLERHESRRSGALLVVLGTGLLCCALRLIVSGSGLRVFFASGDRSVPLGISSPVNIGLFAAGLFWFGVALVLELAPRVASAVSTPTLRTLLFLWSIPALALLVRSALSSVRTLGVLPWPLGIIAFCVLSVFLLTGTAQGPPIGQLAASVAAQVSCLTRRERRPLLGVLGGAFVIAGGLVAYGAVRAHNAGKLRIQEYVRWFASQPRIVSSVLSGDSTILVIVKFHDYQCPPCRIAFTQYSGLIDRFIRAYPGSVKYLVKDFPLDSKCNDQIKRPFHPVACDAAVAVRLARRSGKNVELLERWIFDQQSGFSNDDLWEAAKRISGVTVTKAAYDAALVGVLEDVRDATTLHVQHTPTFFVNGVRLDGIGPLDRFEAVLAHEVDRLGLGPAASSALTSDSENK